MFLTLLFSISALIIFFPVLVGVAIAIHKKMGGGIFFIQRRPGLHGKPFNIIKFKTMSDAKDEHGDLLPDSERLSRFGKILRSTSLDELPELVNVIFGDMSLVGPRPCLCNTLNATARNSLAAMMCYRE